MRQSTHKADVGYNYFCFIILYFHHLAFCISKRRVTAAAYCNVQLYISYVIQVVFSTAPIGKQALRVCLEASLLSQVIQKVSKFKNFNYAIAFKPDQ